jgi:hypothetical protein
MKEQKLFYTKICLTRVKEFLAALGILLSLSACSPACPSRASLQTQTALNVQATLIALQSSQGLEATALAQQIILLEQATLIARQQVQLTAQAAALASLRAQSSPTPAPLPLAATATIYPLGPPLSATPFPSPPPGFTVTPTLDLQAYLKSAHILLYEDMAGDLRTTRYVKAALDSLGMKYVDVADAQGRFKEQLLAAPEDGQTWDLIISANENRQGSGIRGEFFDYFLSHLAQGTAVIIETWQLDAIHSGSAGALLQQCGVAYQGDLWNLAYGEQALFPLAPQHPLLKEPNQNILMQNVNPYWKSGDLGDWLEIIPGSSQATLILGSRPTNPRQYATLAACLEGRLILQTFSTHQYDQEAVIPLWQNYIYHALKARARHGEQE